MQGCVRLNKECYINMSLKFADSKPFYINYELVHGGTYIVSIPPLLYNGRRHSLIGTYGGGGSSRKGGGVKFPTF